MSATEILKQVASKHGLDVDALKGRSRRKEIVVARAEYILRTARERNLSAAQIGRVINRTYSTICYHLDPDLRALKISRAKRYWRAKDV